MSRRRSIRLPFSTRCRPSRTRFIPVKLGTKTINASLKDIIYDATKGDFPHANTMTAKLMAGDKVLLEQEYYSVGGGFIEWKGYTPPKKNPPKYPYRNDGGSPRLHEARQYLDRPARHGQRNVDFGPQRGGDQRLPRQDHRRDARDGEDRPRGADVDLAWADQAQDQGGRRLQERDGGAVACPAAASAWFPPPRSPGPRKMRAATWSSPRRQADRPASCRRSSIPSIQPARSCPTRSCAKACLPVRSSAICASTTRRSRRPKAAARRRSASRRRWARR